jgi:hypothetical protein
MNRDTITKALAELTTLFPQKTLSEKLIDAYEKHLRKIPENQFQKVFDAIVSKSKFFPTVSDFLEAYNTLPKQKSKAAVFCSFCDSNGIVLALNTKTNDTRYFLCPKRCQNAVEKELTEAHMPNNVEWISKAKIASKWCAEHQENSFVKAIQNALANCKTMSYEEAQEANKQELVKFGQGLGINLAKAKPWNYPAKFS